MLTVKIEGLAEIERNLKALPDKIGKKVLRSAVSAGGDVLRKGIVANAKAMFTERTGRLFRGIVKRVRFKSLGAAGAIVRVTIGLRRGGKDSPWYGRLLERGWKHKGRSKRAAGKQVPARPFMARAFEERAQAALDRVIEMARRKFAELNVRGG